MRFYRRRDPFSSPLWVLLDNYYDQFEAKYAERYEKVYGFLRPAIGFAIGKFLKCGDLREGFARVHCDGCGHEEDTKTLQPLERTEDQSPAEVQA